MEQQYKPNSHKSKIEHKEVAEKPKLEKVVSGGVTTKKKSGVSKFLGGFISEDARDVKSYVLTDIIIPGIKKGIFDIITKGADRIFYGKSGSGTKRSTADRYSYASYWNGPRNDDRSRNAESAPKFDNEYFIFNDRGDAEAVLSRMIELAEEYGHVSIADLYDLCDKTAPYTMHKYGWTDLRTASVELTRDGYIIDLPKAVVIAR